MNVRKGIKNNKRKRNGNTRRKGGLIAAVVLALAFFCLLGTYVGGAVYYQTRYLPNTFVNGIACGGMTASELALLLENELSGYSLRVSGRNYATGESGAEIGTIKAGDVSLSYEDSQGEAERILNEQNQWTWPWAGMGSNGQKVSLVQGVTFDRKELRRLTSGWPAFGEENVLEPQDARISPYDGDVEGYEIIPETRGAKLDRDVALSVMEQKICGLERELDLEGASCYAEPAVKSTDVRLTEAVEKLNLMLETRITFNWNGNSVVLDAHTIKDWISVEDGEAVLDAEKVAAFVDRQANAYDTYGKEKQFTTALGVKLTLQRKSYGWQTDREGETEELIRLISQGSVTEREPKYSVKGKCRGTEDLGNSYVEVDLTNQHVYLFQDGTLIYETLCVSGNMSSTQGAVTPEGIFGLTYKTTNAVLSGSTYAEHVNYWMPYYGNYGMHDATWREEFGGDIYLTEGSHGCVNLPLDAAAVIYNYVSKGSPVICYYYDENPPAAVGEGEAAE